MQQIFLDVGCGKRKQSNALGLDIAKLDGVNIVCNLEDGLPFKDNSIDRIYTSHFLEHIKNLVLMMEEIYRVCKPGAIVEIIVPYWKTSLAFQDPTHKCFFTEETFNYFTKDPKRKCPRYSDYGFKCDFNIKKNELSYNRMFAWLKYIPLNILLHPSNTVSELKVILEVNKKV